MRHDVSLTWYTYNKQVECFRVSFWQYVTVKPAYALKVCRRLYFLITTFTKEIGRTARCTAKGVCDVNLPRTFTKDNDFRVNVVDKVCTIVHIMHFITLVHD